MNEIPSNAAIKEISNLAAIQISRELRVAQLEDDLRTAKEVLQRVQEVDLPNAMAAAGIMSIKLPNGASLTIKEDVYASIPKDQQFEAFAWLRDHELGDVIKREVVVEFGRGEEDQAVALVNELQAKGMNNYQTKESVHSQTLKALIREQLAKGAEFPMDLFGAYPVTKAVIKRLSQP